MKKRLFSPLLAAALAAAVALTAAALPAFADGGEETPITIGQSQQQAECTCTALCTGDSVNADCPVCGAEDADLTACEGLESQPATLSNALPVTALAAVPSGQAIYVGEENVTSGGYWTTDDSGNVAAYSGTGTPTDNYIHYDAADNTLTLHNATIRECVPSDTSTYVMGAGIGVFNLNDASKLTIKLEGSNAIENVSTGIFVLAQSSSTGDATLTITGSGSLDASGSLNGIMVQSNSGDATLTIQSADVTLTSNSGNGVTVQAGSAGTQGHTATLTVNGGKLTASGAAGIQFNASNSSYDITTELTVSGNALVDTRNGGIEVYGTGAVNTTADDDATNGGIVFDGKDGTVYGNVILQENLTIGEGESLTIPDGASLNTNGKLTVDGGTLTGHVTGDVIYKVTGVSLNKNTTTIKVGGTETLTAMVEPANATNKAVTWSSDNISVATVDANGLVTAVAEGSATITVTTEDGSKTATCTVIVTNNGSGPVVPPQPSDPAPSQPEGGSSTGSSAPRQQNPVVHNVSNSSAYRKGEYEFWMKVRTRIVSADPGEVIEVNARDNDKMPNSVMQALAAKEDVTLRIRWNGGEEIVIPSAAALQEKMRMFYPLSYLAKFDFAQTPAKKVK